MRITAPKIVVACLMAGGAIYGITVLRGPRPSSEKHRMIEQLEKQNEALHREIESKESYLNRMKQNPDELELEIKRRLLLVNPGSKSFILQEGANAEGAQPSDGGADQRGK